jgi:hypothetical protein
MNFVAYNSPELLAAKRTACQIIDVTSWAEEIEPHQEGARDKNKVTCPGDSPFPFLIGGHTYLFKQSNKRYPTQFWVEVIAFRLGCLMGVPVPPAFISIDTGRKLAGALIEWFYNYPQGAFEEYMGGEKLFLEINPHFDRGKGVQHNVNDLIDIIHKKERLAESFQEHWAQVFCFDAIIGNTDRHQDNWGLVSSGDHYDFSPAFDNGTSMGHEIVEEKLFKKPADFEKYILRKRATHHIRWEKIDKTKLGHFELLKKIIEKYPNMANYMVSCANFSLKSFEDDLLSLQEISNQLPEPYAKLTRERADFIFQLIKLRQSKVLEILR